MMKGFNAAYFAIFPSYLALAVAAYAAFGAEMNSNLIDSLQPFLSDGLMIAIYIIVIVNSLALVSVYVQACFTLIEDVFPCLGQNYYNGRLSLRQGAVRFLYIAFCTFVAIAIPFFGYLAGLAGAICFTPLSVSARLEPECVVLTMTTYTHSQPSFLPLQSSFIPLSFQSKLSCRERRKERCPVARG